MSKENKLLITFTTFMLEHGIECEEDIYQNDKVDEDSLELIEDLFNIVKLTNHTRQTNADRIRNMSDEELAELITGSLNFDCADYCDSFTHGCAINCNKKDREIALKWLQSEAE